MKGYAAGEYDNLLLQYLSAEKEYICAYEAHT